MFAAQAVVGGSETSYQLAPIVASFARLRPYRPHVALTLRRHSSSYRSVPALRELLAAHYHRLDRDVPLREHERTAGQELQWLEQRARAEGYGSGNWQTRLNAMVRDMVEHDKPLAYVLGSQPFHPLPVDLVVRAPILVPRPETEHWVLHLSETILSTATLANDRPFRILDLGTGTGCIALGLTQSLVTSNRFPSVSTLAIDQSNEAVTLARENVERCKLEPSVQVVKLDLFDSDFAHRVVDDREGGHQRFNLVVSNPPYITRTEFESLDPSVKNWEDRAALVGERPSSTTGSDLDDGLIFYHKIASMLDDLLVPGRDELGPGPHVAFEVGKGQARAVETLLSERGFKSEIVSDPWGIERAVFAWKL